MNNFSYCSPTRYLFGRGVEAQTGKLTKEYLGNPDKVLIVYGQGSVKRNGLLNKVIKTLVDENIQYCLLGDIQPNPTDDKVYQGIELGRKENVKALIGLGGGSAIDTAKAIALGIPYQGDFWDFYAGKLPALHALPVGVVLTIPAAGSEGSGNSVITKLDGKHKISLRSDFALRPKFAVMNPEYTFTLPPYQTASGVADMMAHIMERYFTPTENVEVTDGISEGLLKAIMTEAKKVIAEPYNYDARANIMWAGTMAHNGICGCGKTEDWVSHFMEHEISAVYDVTHGAGLAVVFPAWLTFMAEHNPSRVVKFAHNVMMVIPTDNPHNDALEGIRRLREFYSSIGLPLYFKDLNIDNPDIHLLVENLHANKGEKIGGYFTLTSKETAQIYSLML